MSLHGTERGECHAVARQGVNMSVLSSMYDRVFTFYNVVFIRSAQQRV